MKLRVLFGVSIALTLAAVVFAALRITWPAHLRVLGSIARLPADGRFHDAGQFTRTNGVGLTANAVAVNGLPSRVTQVNSSKIELAVQSPVLPGQRTVRISYRNSVTTLRIQFVSSTDDLVGDGTPDFLRLHTAEDRNAFRGWFTGLADAAADLPREKLPREIDDCAALLRWCYRNALHAHDETWLGEAPETLQRTQPSIRQYAYPLTPLGSGLLRVREGSFAPGDEKDGAFAQFADAKTLWRLNTFPLSREAENAHPGDLLFFRQLEQNSPYHSMIVTGATQRWVVYHTGPIDRGPGEVRRVLLQDLLDHPDPRWRPISSNSNFLGVYRWNILREDPR